ncbi:hypothetical protein B0H13DRAFT_2453336 [Mycena leptocephala]|nr:hypothetical protein B0H13DRAFT_2453336 [Mycena leptocephala]
MDRPSWNDTVRAAFGSCVPCLTCSRTKNTANADGDSDDEYTNTNSSVRGVRRARADELEGLLADAHSSRSSSSVDDGWGGGGGPGGDAAADADAISLHRTLASRETTPASAHAAPYLTMGIRSIWERAGEARGAGGRGRGSACGCRLFTASSGRRRCTPEETQETPRIRSGPQREHLLAPRARRARAVPTALADVTEADIERRARGEETDGERRARRKARKEMRRLAAASRRAMRPTAAPHHPRLPARTLPADPVAVFAPSGSAHPSADAAQEDDDAADLDGGSYARLVPRPMGVECVAVEREEQWERERGPYSPGGYANGEVAYVGMPPAGKPKPKRRNRARKSKSSATSSTLASPPATSPASASFPVPHVHAEEDGRGGVRRLYTCACGRGRRL